MKRLRVSHRAKLDLDGIWRHVATDASSADAGDRVVDSLMVHFALLAEHPHAGRSRDEIEPGLRSFSSGQYLIYYRESRSHVVISRVLHGKRDQPAAWRSSEAP
jgi:toxin ParE1/3/4